MVFGNVDVIYLSKMSTSQLNKSTCKMCFGFVTQKQAENMTSTETASRKSAITIEYASNWYLSPLNKLYAANNWSSVKGVCNSKKKLLSIATKRRAARSILHRSFRRERDAFRRRRRWYFLVATPTSNCWYGCSLGRGRDGSKLHRPSASDPKSTERAGEQGGWIAYPTAWSLQFDSRCWSLFSVRDETDWTTWFAKLHCQRHWWLSLWWILARIRWQNILRKKFRCIVLDERDQEIQNEFSFETFHYDFVLTHEF